MPIELAVIQPTSLCNINCSYCYVPNRRDNSMMQDATVDAIANILSDCGWLSDDFSVLWHAGEPLTAGIPFYERAVSSFRRAGLTSRERFHHSIQTNGTLIDDSWCEFFSHHDFTIGVSIDGPEAIHDLHRRSWANSPTHHKAMRGVECLRSHGMPVNAIAVLTRESLGKPDEIFEFFREQEFSQIAFNLDELEGANASSSVCVGLGDAEMAQLRLECDTFWRRMFELWWPKRHSFRIREFDNMRGLIRNKLSDPKYIPRAHEHDMDRNITFSTSGDITCGAPEFASTSSSEFNDFVVGNVHSIESLDEVKDLDVYLRMQTDIDAGISKCARMCYYFCLCGGGPPVGKFCEHGTMNSGETSQCVLSTQTVARAVIDGLISRSGQEVKTP